VSGVTPKLRSEQEPENPEFPLYLLVDHALSRLDRGLVGVLQVEGPDDPEVFRKLPEQSAAVINSVCSERQGGVARWHDSASRCDGHSRRRNRDWASSAVEVAAFALFLAIWRRSASARAPTTSRGKRSLMRQTLLLRAESADNQVP